MIRIVTSLAILALGISIAVGQAVLRVPSTYPTIGAALGAAVQGDVIQVAPGTYAESLMVPHGVHLVGAGPGLTIVDGGAADVTIGLTTATTEVNVIEGLSITGTGHGLTADGGGATLIDCEFFGCGAPVYTYGGSAVNIESGTSVRMVRCEVRNCTGPYAVRSDPFCVLELVACRVLDNALSGVVMTGGNIVDTVVAGHPLIGVEVQGNTNPPGKLDHATVFGNGVGVVLSFMFDIPEITNSIIWGNVTGLSAPAFPIAWSNVQGGVAGIGNIDADPLFADPVNRNFGLLPGSPCLDMGAPMGKVDPDGSRADIGLRSNLPVLAGDGTGNVGVIPCYVDRPLPTLSVNGSFGGPDRRVAVPAGTPVSLALATSYGFPGSFGILGYLGLPGSGDQQLIPGLGALLFPPCFPGPGSNPLVFHLTNSLFPDPCALVPSTTTPWTFTLPAGLPAPMMLVVQGVILLDGPTIMCGTSVFPRVTNAVIVQSF